MAITSDDISVVLSGGSANLNPNNSLGGEPSSTPVVDGALNNLFDDVSPEESEEGHQDYRCIYFFNDGESPFYDINLWIQEDYPGGAVMEVGVERQNETQRITLSNGPVTGGNMILSYAGESFTSSYHSDLNIWAANLQNQLRALTIDGQQLLKSVTVSAQYAGAGSSVIIFDVLFIDSDGYANHPKITLVSDTLAPASVDVTVSVPFEGAPINTIAPEIGVETTPPGNVGFYVPNEGSPISLPQLLPEDGFPLWVKRTIVADSDPQENDGFMLRFSAQTLES